MTGGQALLLLGVLAVALLGVRDLAFASARSAELRERARGEREPSAVLGLLRRIDGAFARTRFGTRVELGLRAAGQRTPPLVAVGLGLAAGVAASLLAGQVVGRFVAIVLGLATARAGLFYLDRKREQRREDFIGQLPDLARTLSNAASAGLSMTAALEVAVQELGPPASDELGTCLEEIRVGQRFDRAFEHLAERLPSRELGVLVSTLVIQQRAGGDLVTALSDMSLTLEQRKDTLREIKTLMSGAVASAYGVALLGLGAMLLVDLTQPGALDRLTSTPVGLLLLGLAAALYALGLAGIKLLTRIDT